MCLSILCICPYDAGIAQCRVVIAASVPIPLRHEGWRPTSWCCLVSRVARGTDRLRTAMTKQPLTARWRSFNLQVGGFATYVLLMSYLLVDHLHETHVWIGVFALAMASFPGRNDHALQDHHGAAYEQTGRPVLAGTPIVGWVIGVAFAMPAIRDYPVGCLPIGCDYHDEMPIMELRVLKRKTSTDDRPWRGLWAYFAPFRPMKSGKATLSTRTTRDWRQTECTTFGCGCRQSCRPDQRTDATQSCFAARRGLDFRRHFRLKGAKAKKPPYFWRILTHPDQRGDMLKNGGKSIGKVFILALIPGHRVPNH